MLAKHIMGSCNGNRHLLLEFCTEQQLTITNTIFQKKDSQKRTWIHPQSKHWHLIDYILVCQCDHKDIFHTGVMLSAECHTEPHLVYYKLSFHFKPKPRKDVALMKKLKVCSLKSTKVRADFLEDLQSRLEEYSFPTTSPSEDLWDHIKATILQTSKEVLGYNI